LERLLTLVNSYTRVEIELEETLEMLHNQFDCIAALLVGSKENASLFG
jgi:hypothetical protein